MPEADLPPAARAPWVLALDAGSSSVRAGLFDRFGRPLAPDAVARVGVAWRASAGGAMEADADEFLAACVAVIDGAVAAARAAGITVEAVGGATLWHGLVGVADDGRAVTPLYGWGDTRAREDAAALAGRLDAAAYHRRTGCFVHELYPAARLVWLRRTAGDSFPRVAAWGSVGELLWMRLFGARRTSVSMASGTGLLDVGRCAWDAETLAAVGVGADRLPEVSDEPVRGLLPGYARRWPELAEVPWFPALGDGACASLGSGACGARLAITVGTSAAVRALRDDAAAVPEGLWCYRLDARRTVAGRALSNAGSAFAWLRRTLALPPADELEAALAAEPPGAHHLTVVPDLLGERPPLSGAPGASVEGLTLETTPVRIARAWMEAVAARIADAVRAVEAEVGPAAEIVAGGGALHASPTWARMIARALGRPMVLTAEAELTVRGAALVALERIGALGDAMAAERPAVTAVEPE
jgi:gluconokinase